MKIALVSDEWHPINPFVLNWLISRKYKVELYGSFLTQKDEAWVDVIFKAGCDVANNLCDQGIFFCWSGTGASIVANKIPSLRAALCLDAETARLARIWNHANILALSNRSLKPKIAEEILYAWFDDYDKKIAEQWISKIKSIESNFSK